MKSTLRNRKLDSFSDKPLCGARTRRGPICDRPLEPGRKRCRLHGGAAGSGAPSGSENGRYVDGNFTEEAKAERRLVRQILAGRAEADMATKSAIITKDAVSPSSEKPRRVSAQVYQSGCAGEYSAKAPPGQTEEAWMMKLRDVLGSRSKPFIEACLKRLITACCLPRQTMPSSIGVSAALALIESLEPKNEIEAALAVEIACLHAACGYLLGRLTWSMQERPTIAAANATAKLERALHSAIKTYSRLKHGNTQIIRIEKIEIQQGAQALVGPIVRA
jgi:hypothetical protein